jgi:hypothetical protein
MFGMKRRVGLAGRVCGLSFVSAALLGGCSVEVTDPQGEEGPTPGGEEVATADQDLNVKSTVIWQNLSVPVCWENPTTATAVARSWVSSQITNTWQAFSQVRFSGWDSICTTASTGVRIRIANQTASTGPLLGRQLDGVVNGVTLNLTMTAPADYATCAATWGVERCVRATAMHEFGHVLGFAHEQMRADGNFDCLTYWGGDLGDTYVGAYDKSSIMNTCNLINRMPLTLTATDKLGLQAFYGHSSPSTQRKDAVVWNSDTIYFFFGANVTQFSVPAAKSVSLFPAKISGTFTGWPTTGTWPTGVDAAADYSSTKVYLFSGNQYLRMTKSTKAVDAGYPRALPGGWINWPSTWTSVTGAIKWTDGKLYLFRGGEYISLTGTTVDGPPRPIYGDWNVGYTTGFDYGFVHPTRGVAYFFKGPKYVRVTTSPEAVDYGYPKEIVGRWPGVTF